MLRKIGRAIVRAANKIRAAEPAWLADKRKPIAGAVAAAVVGWLGRVGINLTHLQTDELALAIGALVAWAIPNKPAKATNTPNGDQR